MNWKNIVHLIRVDRKSGRLVRGRRLTRYRERRIFTYIIYGGALALGLLAGIGGGVIYTTFSAVDPQSKALFDQAMPNLFLSLPTLVLIYSLVFTMMQQIQRSGVKFSIQAPYWLPITWEEHTVAAAFANLLGFLAASVVFISASVLVLSIFMNLIAYALVTLAAVVGSAFMASVITEIMRVLQIRFIGAVYKSSGRAAVWVRFVGSLLFLILFYIVYFMLTGAGAVTFVQTIASGQSVFWFVPFVWLGMTQYSFLNGLILQTLVFSALSVLFIVSLFYAAVLLNRRFGLYEPPSITVSRGLYAPKVGFLGKLGFSMAEAALIRKDLKAFTRRRELIFVFIAPLVVIMVPLLQAFGQTGGSIPAQAAPYLFAVVFLMPGGVLAFSLGSIIVGEEGEAIWRIYASPIPANSLVKSKYFFMIFFSSLVTIVTGLVGTLAFHPSVNTLIIAIAIAFFLMFAISAVALANGIKGADFTELPRPRMIRRKWSLANLALCALASGAIVAPLIPVALTLVAPSGLLPNINPYLALAISAAIALTITLMAYRVAIGNARELLAKAEA
jgi:hypothetical protein